MLPHLPGLAENLARIAEPAVEGALAFGGPRSGGAPKGEVAAVKAVILDGFARVGAGWANILGPLGYRLELRPVFVHSRPHVIFSRAVGGSGTCELADLLVVIDHEVPGSQKVDRRAVLIQAKLAKSSGIRLRGREWIQFELLSTWPSFTFATGGYDPRARQFDVAGQPGDPVTSGEYGAIKLPPAKPQWVQQLVSPPKQFGGDAGLGEFLAQMALGVGIYGREAEPGGTDDWSFTVDELLRVTAALPIVKSSSQLRGQSYGAGFLSLLESTAPEGGSYDAPPPGDEGDEPWPEGPISTVQLIARVGEEFAERRG